VPPCIQLHSSRNICMLALAASLVCLQELLKALEM
jgi:hypothetical protein